MITLEKQRDQMLETELAVQRRFSEVEEEMLRHPQVPIDPTHFFAPGVYARQILIPAGTLLTGKIHRHEHLNIISQGEILVWNEAEGERLIKAPFSFVSPAGTRRIGFARTDVVWTTIHANPEDDHDLEKLENRIIAPPALMAAQTGHSMTLEAAPSNHGGPST